jgi:hypothetical protein
MEMDGVTSLITEKWQPACFAGNLKLIRYGYNILYVVFNTREFHKMSNPIIRQEIQNSFF